MLLTQTKNSVELAQMLNLLSSAQVEHHYPISYITDMTNAYAAEAFINVLQAPTVDDFKEHIEAQCEYYNSAEAIDDEVDNGATLKQANEYVEYVLGLNQRVLEHYRHVYAIYNIDRLTKGE